MSLTKAWDWSKNTDAVWLQPCTEIPYLAERWQSFGFGNFLDLGCGLGRHSLYMAKKGFAVSAVDLSDYAVEYLQKWASEEQVNVNIKKADMLSLPFSDSSFDCVLAYNVIYHTDTAGFSAALKEIHRVLR